MIINRHVNSVFSTHYTCFFARINPMKTPSKSPDVSLQTPLASGMALASTSAPDLLLLLQQLASQQQEIYAFKLKINTFNP
jgi:hypothetical protein